LVYLVENLSNYSEEEIEYERDDFDENRACQKHYQHDENHSETHISFHEFSSFVPPYFYQSVSVQRCDRDEIEDSERDIQETEIYPKTYHQIHLIQKDIVRRSSHDFRVDQYHEDSNNCQNQIRRRSCERDHELSFARMLIIERIDLHGFPSSEMRYKDHKESYGIDMLKRIRS